MSVPNRENTHTTDIQSIDVCTQQGKYSHHRHPINRCLWPRAKKLVDKVKGGFNKIAGYNQL